MAGIQETIDHRKTMWRARNSNGFLPVPTWELSSATALYIFNNKSETRESGQRHARFRPVSNDSVSTTE